VQGKIFGLVGMGRDITERKRIEEALAQEQYLMQALMDNIPDYIYFKDLESRFIRISKAHAQSFGLSDPAQAVGKTDFDFFTEEHARPAYEDEQRIIRTGQPLVDMEEKETRPDRPDAWVLTTKMPLRDEDGRIVGTFGLSRDITERKQAEAERERLLTTLEHRNAHLQTAAEVARTATSILDVGQLLPRVVDLISEHFGYYQVNVFLIDESGQWAVLRAATGEAGQQMLKDGARLPVGGQSIVGWVTGTGQPHVSQDIASDPLYLPHSRLPDTRAEAVIPLVVGDAVIGALDVESAQPNVFGPNAIPILTIMADQVAIAIENSRLYAKVQQLAITDGLTGLYNRRGFFELGRHEFERARRFGRPLAAVMLDLDYLKEVNDTYGHAVGDQVLAGVGVLCRGELREVDLLGRYGGDEFVALLPECDVAGAKGVAERLRQSIAQTPVKTERGAVTMSVSLGVAVLDKGCADLEGLLNRADQALLRAAKRAGRNRVSVWNGH
jgi:diguanylate cyclase (GGDEF)-like protein/PAS domain S-box-containing protein